MALQEYKTRDLEECMQLQQDGVLMIGIKTIGFNKDFGKVPNQLRKVKEFTFLVPEKETKEKKEKKEDK